MLEHLKQQLLESDGFYLRVFLSQTILYGPIYCADAIGLAFESASTEVSPRYTTRRLRSRDDCLEVESAEEKPAVKCDGLYVYVPWTSVEFVELDQ